VVHKIERLVLVVTLVMTSGTLCPIVFSVTLSDLVLYRVVPSDSCRAWFSCVKVNAP